MTRLIAAILFCIALLPVSARAETFNTCKVFIQSVPTTISTQGVYCLNQDLATAQSSGAAITVTSNNVTIDCNGYKLGGLSAGLGTAATGISASNTQNLTVRNCNIRGFANGIDVSGSGGGHLVENNIFNANTVIGIAVEGDGSRIRNNAITDTGGGTGSDLAEGIAGSSSVDITGNLVDGVSGTTGANASVFGIRLTGGNGASVIGNTVRNLITDGTGLIRGIYTSNGLRIFVDDNRVGLPAASTGSMAFRCNASNGSMRNNTGWGFDTFSSGCLDDGGNVSH